MYTLISGFYKYVTQKDEYFILILGLDNSGKSTYLEQVKTQLCVNYKMMNPSKITTTVGCNIGRVDIGRVRLNFWDLGGQEELQSLWDKYYAECHAIIYMIGKSNSIYIRVLSFTNRSNLIFRNFFY
jgi:ADP-ribosylation factor related protein 1